MAAMAVTGSPDDFLTSETCHNVSVPCGVVETHEKDATSTSATTPARSGSHVLHFLDDVEEEMLMESLKQKQDRKRRERVENAEEEVEAVLTDPKPTNSRLKRLYRLHQAEQFLCDFLQKHKFGKDIHEPRTLRAGCAMLPFFGKKDREELYPLHVAAQQGDLRSLRLLLRRGADRSQATSRGRSALDLAREADVAGSHAEVIHLLKSEVKFLRARDMILLSSKVSR